MQIIHAHWQPPISPVQPGRFLIWSESASRLTEPAKIDRRRKVHAHPFAQETTLLSQEIKRLTGLALPFVPEGMTLRLPSSQTMPQPSPGLRFYLPEMGAPLSLHTWAIPALGLEPADAFDFLLNLPAADALPQDVKMGDDLRFWAVASRLALESIIQQKVLPGLVADEPGNTLYARWLPVLDGPKDGPRLARLREAMPPLCRAGSVEGDKKSDRVEDLSPHFLLDTFLAGLVDGLMRRWRPGDTPAAPVNRWRITSTTLAAGPDDWPTALCRDNAQVNLSPGQAGRILTSYTAWLRTLNAAGDRHFRVTLRLEAPSQGEGSGSRNWTLHFLLQARDDPSLLIDAGQVWRSRGNILSRLEQSAQTDRRLDNPQELLLTGLGFVARHSDPVRRTLQDKNPTAVILSDDEAYAFLRQTAPLLEGSGFGVLVPPWWNKPGTRLGVRLRMQGSASGGDSDGVGQGLVTLENLVRYRWEISIGGQAISREEFEALVALKSPLVQIRGQWVQLDSEQIEAAIRFWEKQEMESEMSLLEAATLALDGTSVDGLAVEGVEAEGWLHTWMERFTGNEALALLPPPGGLNATLRPYQSYGFSWLDFQRRFGIGACLADDMGLGKTIQTLAVLQRVKETTGSLPGPSLLIAPTSVVVNWAKEAARFTPDLRILVHQGADRLRDDEFLAQARAADMVATSYALAWRDGETLEQINWFGVILDEAQNIKNPETKQARTIRKLPASFRMALTGTPVENRLTELWSIMHFLNPGFLGSRQGFRKQFALPIERYDDEAAAQRLRRLVSPFILRRVKSDPTVITDLPEKQEMKEYCYLSEEQATLYQAVVADALDSINAADEEMQRRGRVLSMLMKLKQICNHPAQFLHQVGDGSNMDGEVEGAKRSGKLQRLEELLEELLEAGDRALIFSQFAEMGSYLQHHLQQRFGRPVLFLHGGTPAIQRQQMVDRFQEEINGPAIFVLSLKAGGTGLNLTRANHVFHFDRWWNPAVEDQATDRAFRIGQKQNVQVHKFVCVGTLEENIDAMIEQKKALAQAIVGSGENWLTEMSTADLQELVHLRREALA